MSSGEKQADEILVLQSIFDRNFRLLDENQYEILIEFDLPPSFTLQFDHQISPIEYLPPLTLIIQYHEEYPTIYPPSFILSCFYFSKYRLQKLCQRLDDHPFVEDEVCVYDWTELIREEMTIDQLILDANTVDEQKNDPRALNGYFPEDVGKIYQYLVNYNHERQDEQFRHQLQTCWICTETLPGTDCLRLHRCGHYFCRSCLKSYVQMRIENGKFGEKIHCPENECEEALLPTEVQRILPDDQMYQRYERLTLQHGLESMNDILWCPR